MAIYTRAIQGISSIASNGYRHLANVAGTRVATGLVLGGAIGASRALLDDKEGNFFGSVAGHAILGSTIGWASQRLSASGYGLKDLVGRVSRGRYINLN
jgi:hypothetical protein